MKIQSQIKYFILLATVFLFASCSDKNNQGMSGAKSYQVMTVGLTSAQLYKDYTAALEGQQTVEIRPRISGYIEKIYVDEGARVSKGQMLFRLNDNELRAVYLSCQALVKVAEAELVTARINLEKNKPLVENKIVSKYELQSSEAALKAKEAQLAQAKANLKNAQANLQYTQIKSPADGAIGTFPYRVGSLVSSTSAEPMTTVSDTKKIHAYFSLNEKEFLALTRELKGSTIQEKLSKLPAVSLLLADNSVFEHSGNIETASGLINEQTGTVNMRAAFKNPDDILRSGGSGTIRIPQNIKSAILIPQKAVFELQGKYFAFVVNSDNTVTEKEIEILTGNLRDSYVVTGGLKPGERIVVEGVSSLNSGIKIIPKPVKSGSK